MLRLLEVSGGRASSFLGSQKFLLGFLHCDDYDSSKYLSIFILGSSTFLLDQP